METSQSENIITPINGFPDYVISRNGEVFRVAKNGEHMAKAAKITVFKSTSGNGKKYDCVRLRKGKAKCERRITQLLLQHFGEMGIDEKVVSGEFIYAPEYPGYLFSATGEVFREDGKEIMPAKNSSGKLIYVFVIDGKRVSKTKQGVIFDFMKTSGKVQPVKEFPDYFIDHDGNIYNQFGNLIKPINRERDNYSFVLFYEAHGGKRFKRPRGLAKLVAEHLIENKHGHQYLKFIDGNHFNCHPSNLQWISDEEYKTGLSQLLRDCHSNTREFALANCKCPVLLKYYSFGDIDIIKEEILKGLNEMRHWYKSQVKSELFSDLIDRVERRVIMTPIRSYILKVMKFYKYKHFKVEHSCNKEFNEVGRSKLTKKRRVMASDLN